MLYVIVFPAKVCIGGFGVSTVLAPQALLPKMKGKKSKWLYGGAAIVVALGGAFAYTQTSNRTIPIAAFDRHTVTYGNVTETVGASGTVQVPNAVQLNFSGVSGTLKTVNVAIGQTVTKGQTLATLDDATQRIQIEVAQAGVLQSQGNVTQARSKLTQAREKATQATIALAQASVNKARETLSGAKTQLQDQITLYQDRASANQQLISAQNTVQEQYSALQSAQINVKKAQLQQQQTLNGNTQQDASSLRDNITVTEQAVNSANQQLSLAESNLSLLQQALQSAEQTLTTDTQGSASSAQIQADENAVRQSQQSYNSGESAILQNQNSVQNAQLSLVNAEKALADAQPSSNTVVAQLANNSVAVAQSQLNQSQIQYESAKANLRVIQTIYNDRNSAKQQVDNAKNAVQQDQIGLQSAIASYDQTVQPPDPNTITADQAAVLTSEASYQSAKAQLQSAQLAESETVLTAPFSGMIAQVNGVAGEASSSSQPLIVLDQGSQASLQLDIQVPESSIGSIKAKEAVNITATTYPGKTFAGEITVVYPTPTVVSNVTMYTVMASIQNVGSELKPGMTVNVSINTQTAFHVVVIPAISLVQQGVIEGVYVIGKRTPGAFFRKRGTGGGTGFSGSGGSFGGGGGSSGTTGTTGGAGGFRGRGAGSNTPYGNQVYFQPIQTGIFGIDTIQVTSGLKAGQQILLVPPSSSSSSTSSSSTSGRGLGGGLGGGLGRGGLGRAGFGG